jgi:hypothetical protein
MMVRKAASADSIRIETAGPATRMRSATEVHEQERQPTAESGSGFRL